MNNTRNHDSGTHYRSSLLIIMQTIKEWNYEFLTGKKVVVMGVANKRSIAFGAVRKR